MDIRNATVPLLWDKGIIAPWYLRPGQQEIANWLKKTEDPFLEAGRRWGKTTTVLVDCMEFLADETGEVAKQWGINKGPEDPGIIRWCEPWKKQCREIVIPEINQIQSKIPPEKRFKWSTTDSFFYHPKTDGKLYLVGVNDDKGESARGSKAHIIVADELGSWKDVWYILKDVLTPQLLTTFGPVIHTGTPPRNLAHLFYKMVDKAIFENRYMIKTLDDMEDVPQHAKDRLVRSLGGRGHPTCERELYCKRVVDKNFAIVPEFDKQNHVKSTAEQVAAPEFPYWKRYESLDIGVRHLTCNLWGFYNFVDATLYIQDEFNINGPELTTELLAEAIRAKDTELWGIKYEKVEVAGRVRWKAFFPTIPEDKQRKISLRRVSDKDLLLVQDLSNLHALFYDPTDKGKLEEMVNEMRIWVGAGRVIVDPRCKKLIACLEMGLWDEHRKKWEETELPQDGELVDDAVGYLGHFDPLASLMYMIRNVDTRTNPLPTDFMKPKQTHWVADRDGVENKSRKRKIAKALGAYTGRKSPYG